MRKLNIVLTAVSLIVAAPAIASGSGGGGGYSGGGGGGYSGGGYSSSPQPSDVYAVTYGKGKKMFTKRIICKTCTYSNGVSDSKTAREVAAKVKAGEFNLKSEERTAVLFYISERFGVRA